MKILRPHVLVNFKQEQLSANGVWKRVFPFEKEIFSNNTGIYLFLF